MLGNKLRVCQKECSLPPYLHNSKTEYAVYTYKHDTFPLHSSFLFSFSFFSLSLARSLHLNAESLPQDIFWLQSPLSFRWRQTTVCVITATNKASCLNHNVAWCQISSWTAVNSISMFNNSVADWINHEVPLHIFHIEGEGFYLGKPYFVIECIL